ncbi:uncharacterized protein BDZ99DRAFT_495208 [Mytilinidion resinicola]|uniref:F-box domain-containing protein n=1 Tax=Mytilinidion resinicola TaxID=574789 RepID=A0A6A6Z5D1_9PEZI|nr:uncharacterized protein BDZ99DRAFT_495208 [Mytilinidion resinicola]KAF2815457.1 hypothetical protein BDZ99DRAFT_495208 [Mytilinidion resinicola]
MSPYDWSTENYLFVDGWEKSISALPCRASSGHCSHHYPEPEKRESIQAPSSTSVSAGLAHSSGARGTPQLVRLPAELFLQIVDYLPPHAGMALALTCRFTYASIGSRFSASLPKDPFDERLEFFRLLRRDFPDYKGCHSCRSLHKAFSQHKIKIPIGIWNLPAWPEWYRYRALVYVLEPLTAKARSSAAINGRRPLYLLTNQHARLIERPIQQCLGSLTCFGEMLFPDDGSPLAGVRYQFKFEPSIVGNTISWRAWQFVDLTNHGGRYDDLERARTFF